MSIAARTAGPPALITRQRNAILAALLVGAAAAWAAVLSRAGDEVHAPMGGHDAAAIDLTMGMGAAAYLATWVAMMAAMMFPAAAPMVLTFARLQERRRARGGPYVPVAVFAGAYLALWTAFGAAAFGVSAALESIVSGDPGIASAWGRVAGAILVVAGAYQLSPLKDRCLSACRSPLALLAGSWKPGKRGAVRLGLLHGVYCIGCCWLLFVVLVALGVMSVAAMLVVALVVFAEKTLPHGRAISRTAAAALIAVGVAGVLFPAVLPTAVV